MTLRAWVHTMKGEGDVDAGQVPWLWVSCPTTKVTGDA